MTVVLCAAPLAPAVDAHQAPMEDAGAHLQGGVAPQGEKHSYFQCTRMVENIPIDQNTWSFPFSAPEGTGGLPAPEGEGALAQDTGGTCFALKP